MTTASPSTANESVPRQSPSHTGRTRIFQGIHGVVAKRLLAVWLLLSLGVGGVIAYLEIRKIDERAFGLALSASESLRSHVGSVGVEHAASLAEALTPLLSRNFILAQVADAKGVIAEAVAPGQDELLARVDPPQRTASGTGSHRMTWLSDELLLQLSVPIEDRQGNPRGIFSGVYRVDAVTRQHAEEDLVRNVSVLLLAILTTTVALYPVIIGLNKGVLHLSAGVMRSNIELMEVLGSAIAKRDSETDQHNYRVCLYCIRFAEALGLPDDEIRSLIAGAFLHDVGKIGISDSILLKPGKLTGEEFSVMRTHVRLGTDIVARSSWLDSAREVIEFHHEHFDGGGYLRGLKGEAIPLAARLFAIVDVFDALTSRRPYKAPFPLEEAMRVLDGNRGSHFDPRLLEVFEWIAAGVQAELAGLTETGLRDRLHTQVTKYFFEGSDFWEKSGCPAWLAEQCGKPGSRPGVSGIRHAAPIA